MLLPGIGPGAGECSKILSKPDENCHEQEPDDERHRPVGFISAEPDQAWPINHRRAHEQGDPDIRQPVMREEIHVDRGCQNGLNPEWRETVKPNVLSLDWIN